MKKTKWFIMTALLIGLLGMNVYAAEKDYTVNVAKEYSSAKITVDLPEKESEYTVTVMSPDKKKSYTGVYSDEDTIECIINEPLKMGDWTVRVERIDPIVISEEETEEAPAPEETVEEIKDVKIKFEGSMEKIADVTKDIVVAEDIVGLEMFFKDDNFVAKWTDTTCGNVNIEITNEKTMESLDKETVQDNYYELPLDKSIESIIVQIVPATSANEEGAEKQYTFKFENNPDATVTFEDVEITNKDSINTHIVLNDTYAVLLMGNNKEVMQTELLSAGEYDFDLPTEVGENQYLVYIIDTNGNMRSTAGSVEKDVVAPILQLAQEYVQINTQSESIILEGKVEDYDTFTINGTPVEVEGDKTFKYDYKLKEGLNQIDITALDKAGNVSNYAATVNRIIPVEKPIPWLKIIIGCVVAAMVGLYIYDVIRKHYGGSDTKGNKGKTKKKNNEPVDKKKQLNGTISDILALLIPLAVVYVLMTFVVGVTVIQSASMEPTLMTGDTVFVNRLAYKTGDNIQRGDVVIFHSDEYGVDFGKRVIGLPGDTVEFKDGYVVINGQYTDESQYLTDDIETNSLKVFTVPAGHYFMLGDNRENSNDSRYWNEPYISEENIIGRYMGRFGFSIQFDIIEKFF